MLRVALVTSSKYPNLTADDRLLLVPLAERGIQAEAAIWDDVEQNWSSYDLIVLRSPWDYHLKPAQFLRWIDSLAGARMPLWNPPSLVRWNADKTYLRDLDAKGIATVPTLWPESGDRVALVDQLHDLGWKQAVVKPRISATAYRTQLVTQEDAHLAQDLVSELQAGAGAMIQKFMDAVVDEGEWSLMFFAGEFSHAVLKTPKARDFRVQSDFGGSERAMDPPGHVLEAAMQIVHKVESTLYARVDGVVDEGQFRLMELELIEPALFLSSCSTAAVRFADAIRNVLTSRAA